MLRPGTMTPQQRFSLAADLLYPAALGAGIAGWVEGFIGWRAHENPTRLAIWTLAFGLFFIAYHARNFIVLRDEYGREEKKTLYYSTTFTRDVVDCVALVAAFMCLRFPGGKMRLADPVGVYVVALLIPFSALITDARWKDRKSWLGRAVALAPPLAGSVYAYFEGDRFEPHLRDFVLLGLLLLLLVFYLFDPEIYGVRRLDDVPKGEFKGTERRVRVGAAVLVSLLVLWFAASRVRFEPSETKLEKWVYVGKVDHFVIGMPCSRDTVLEHQVKHLDSLLVEQNPARIKLVGSADTIPLTPLTRDFFGNNAGLAHFRAECVQRWLVTTDHFAGVEFQTDGDAPSHLDYADPVDRAVIAWVVPKDEATLKKRHRAHK
jgi:hypothetical protein